MQRLQSRWNNQSQGGVHPIRKLEAILHIT